LRTFKRSRDPSFATKLIDIVGLDVIRRPTLWCSCSDEGPRSKLSTAPGLATDQARCMQGRFLEYPQPKHSSASPQ
jgi:hypothetical protein